MRHSQKSLAILETVNTLRNSFIGVPWSKIKKNLLKLHFAQMVHWLQMDENIGQQVYICKHRSRALLLYVEVPCTLQLQRLHLNQHWPSHSVKGSYSQQSNNICVRRAVGACNCSYPVNHERLQCCVNSRACLHTPVLWLIMIYSIHCIKLHRIR